MGTSKSGIVASAVVLGLVSIWLFGLGGSPGFGPGPAPWRSRHAGGVALQLASRRSPARTKRVREV
jgi:hypothetical protein